MVWILLYWAFVAVLTVNAFRWALHNYEVGNPLTAVMIATAMLALDAWAIVSARRRPGSRPNA